jgi:hypothetical protein
MMVACKIMSMKDYGSDLDGLALPLSAEGGGEERRVVWYTNMLCVDLERHQEVIQTMNNTQANGSTEITTRNSRSKPDVLR